MMLSTDRRDVSPLLRQLQQRVREFVDRSGVRGQFIDGLHAVGQIGEDTAFGLRHSLRRPLRPHGVEQRWCIGRSP